MSTSKTPEHIKLDERNHVEKSLLDQLDGLRGEIIDLRIGVRIGVGPHNELGSDHTNVLNFNDLPRKNGQKSALELTFRG